MDDLDNFGDRIRDTEEARKESDQRHQNEFMDKLGACILVLIAVAGLAFWQWPTMSGWFFHS